MTELPRFILGIDPGKKTGVALYDLLLETIIGEEVGYPQVGGVLEQLIATYHPVVVGEKFIINSATVKNTQAPWSLKVLGVAEIFATKYGCAYVEQPQSSAKRFATNERLKELGWYVPGRGHMADAQRQVLLFITDHGWWSDALGS